MKLIVDKIGIDILGNLIFNPEFEIDDWLVLAVDVSVDLPVTYWS